ncbi:hypothetical protein EJ06DRAFT_482930, partial [Trichodelitschia bisporula]
KVVTIAYLVFFSILGTLARLGIQAITVYPGAPLVTGVAWANAAGCLVMGFLAEDRRLFATDGEDGKKGKKGKKGGSSASNSAMTSASTSASHNKEMGASSTSTGKQPATAPPKKAIPLYVGLTTGFCGSLTSFSSLMRDAFLALSNDLPSPLNHPYPPGAVLPSMTSTVHRAPEKGLAALLAVILTTMALSIAALQMGAHGALGVEKWMPRAHPRLRKVLNIGIVPVATLAWIGAVLMAIFPPHKAWRGDALFACVFAPAGCLARWYVSGALNGVRPSFPLGTFAVNVFGTVGLGVLLDLQRTGTAGSGVGCQVWQGVMDGGCGCLTTVSTFVAELSGLRRGHAWGYGLATVVSGVAVAVGVMGGVRWGVGWGEGVCRV